MRNSRLHGCHGLGSSDWVGNAKLSKDVDRIYESRMNPLLSEIIYDSAMNACILRPFEMERCQGLRLSGFYEVETKASLLRVRIKINCDSIGGRHGLFGQPQKITSLIRNCTLRDCLHTPSLAYFDQELSEQIKYND